MLALAALVLAGARAAADAGDWVSARRAAIPPGPAQPAPARGVFLIASRRLEDPNFKQAVVLLVAHGPQGALGIVINRPTGATLGDILPDVKALQARADPLFVGGPVARERITLLVRSERAPERSSHVFGDVYVTGSAATLAELAALDAARTPFRAYAGYAGWAPGQLEGEIERGDWFTTAAHEAEIFAEDPQRVWHRLIHRSAGYWVDGGWLPGPASSARR